MQSDPPQGDPRLQRIDPGSKVATGYSDPCIVYLETTLPGEIPLLAACWAESSHEICEPGLSPYLELNQVVIIQNQFRTKIDRKNLWVFGIRLEKSIFLIRGAPGRGLAKCSYNFTRFESAPTPIFRCAIRQLERETHESLEKMMWKPTHNSTPFIQAVLESAKLDWPSISDALASHETLIPQTVETFQKARVPGRRKPSFVDSDALASHEMRTENSRRFLGARVPGRRGPTFVERVISTLFKK